MSSCSKLLALFAIATTACAAAACASPPHETTVTVGTLDQAAYDAQVHPIFVKTCGATTCHGKAPRGLQVYGEGALRQGNATGPTTPGEMAATYQSIVGLEPEKLNAFLADEPRQEAVALQLLVLAKPLAIERHRGGTSLRKGEAAEQCILTWLLGHTDSQACAAAAIAPTVPPSP
jgi:hypothetical protein